MLAARTFLLTRYEVERNLLTLMALTGAAARVAGIAILRRRLRTPAIIRPALLVERYTPKAALVQVERSMPVALVAKLSALVDTTPTGEAQASKALRFTI